MRSREENKYVTWVGLQEKATRNPKNGNKDLALLPFIFNDLSELS